MKKLDNIKLKLKTQDHKLIRQNLVKIELNFAMHISSIYKRIIQF